MDFKNALMVYEALMSAFHTPEEIEKEDWVADDRFDALFTLFLVSVGWDMDEFFDALDDYSDGEDIEDDELNNIEQEIQCDCPDCVRERSKKFNIN